MTFDSVSQQEAPNYGLPILGKVVDNNDPLKQQRVRVSIPGLLEGEVADLPWVAPKINSPFGVGVGFGTVGVPAIGSFAVVYFQDESIYYGLLDGFMQTAECTIDPAFATNYPNRYGFKDPIGNKFVVDMTPSAKTVQFFHASGNFSFQVDNDGSIVGTTSQSATLTANGGYTVNANTTINGTLHVTQATTIDGNTQINANVTATGNGTIQGNMGVTGNTTAANVTASANVTGHEVITNGQAFSTHRHDYIDNPSGALITGAARP